jgi:Leucine-rich repeat (LRR) protein
MGKPGGELMLKALCSPNNILLTLNKTVPVGMLGEHLNPAIFGLSLDLSGKDYHAGEAVVLGYYIAGNLALSSLDLTGNHFGGFYRDKGNFKQQYVLTPDGTTAISKALQQNITLKSVNLSKTELGGKTNKDGLIAVMTMLKRAEGELTHLDLSDNSISAKDSQLVADGLRANNTLRWLNLDNNDIRSKGAKKIAASLKQNKVLQTLLLANNKVLRKDVARAFADALSLNETVKELDFSHNNWERDFAGSDIWAGEPAGFVKIMSAAISDFGIVQSSNLTKLNLSGNRISRKKSKEMAALCDSKGVDFIA